VHLLIYVTASDLAEDLQTAKKKYLEKRNHYIGLSISFQDRVAEWDKMPRESYKKGKEAVSVYKHRDTKGLTVSFPAWCSPLLKNLKCLRNFQYIKECLQRMITSLLRWFQRARLPHFWTAGYTSKTHSKCWKIKPNFPINRAISDGNSNSLFTTLPSTISRPGGRK